MILLRLITWPYVRKHLLRSVLTTAGIVLGVALLVGMRTADQSDAIDGLIPARVVTPENEAEISEILKWAVNSDARLSVRGGGTKAVEPAA